MKGRCLTCFRDNVHIPEGGMMCGVCERMHYEEIRPFDLQILAGFVQQEAKKILDAITSRRFRRFYR